MIFARIRPIFTLLILLASLAACAEISQTPSKLAPSSDSQIFSVGAEVTAKSTGGYPRTLGTGTRWARIGQIREGTVLSPVGSVLTVEGIHVREAYLVVRNKQWVGFWLPNEETFSPVDTAVPVNLIAQRR